MKTLRKLTLFLLFSLVNASCFADAQTDFLAQMQLRYPKTLLKKVKPSPFPGIYEVTMGKNVAYVDQSGRYFLFGNLFDMQTQTDLTSAVQDEANAVDFASLPKQDALKFVVGNGKRQLALFADPHCPYCVQFQQAMLAQKDYTLFIFMLPLDGLHPEASRVSQAIWCDAQPEQAWLNTVLHHGNRLDAKPSKSSEECTALVKRNAALAEKLAIAGTPILIGADGVRHEGALAGIELESWLMQHGSKP
jgi:thiol:disulfide interchange protein DsbC